MHSIFPIEHTGGGARVGAEDGMQHRHVQHRHVQHVNLHGGLVWACARGKGGRQGAHTHTKDRAKTTRTTRIPVKEMLASERRFLETAFGKRLVPRRGDKDPKGNKATRSPSFTKVMWVMPKSGTNAKVGDQRTFQIPWWAWSRNKQMVAEAV